MLEVDRTLEAEFEADLTGFGDCENLEVEKEFLAGLATQRWIANQAAERKHTPWFDSYRNEPGVSVAPSGE